MSNIKTQNTNIQLHQFKKMYPSYLELLKRWTTNGLFSRLVVSTWELFRSTQPYRGLYSTIKDPTPKHTDEISQNEKSRLITTAEWSIKHAISAIHLLIQYGLSGIAGWVCVQIVRVRGPPCRAAPRCTLLATVRNALATRHTTMTTRSPRF